MEKKTILRNGGVLFLFLCIGFSLGIFIQKTVERDYKNRLSEDFNLAAGQRASTIITAFSRMVDRFYSLRNFFQYNDEISSDEFLRFTSAWVRNFQGLELGAKELTGERKSLEATFPWSEGPIRSVTDRMEERLMSLVARVVSSGDGNVQGALLLAEQVQSENGKRYIIAERIDIKVLAESTIGATVAWGLPTSIFLEGPSPTLLFYHAPRLDEFLKKPLWVAEKKPLHTYNASWNFINIPLRIRVDGSPGYEEVHRQRIIGYVWPVTTLLFLLFGFLFLQIGTYIRRAGIAVRRAEEELRSFFDLSPDLWAVLDTEGRIIRCNDSWETVVGMPVEESRNRRVTELVIDSDRATMEQSFRTGPLEIQKEAKVSRFVSREGKMTDIEWKTSPGKDVIFLVGRDVSERIRYEQNLEQAVKEKEMLLREVHHRVKNNLQIVSSMLNLQQDEYEDPRLNSILERAQNRIRSMALVHESLYRSENIAGLPFKTYAETLLSAFSITEQGRGVEIVVNADPLVFSLDLAIHCGLLLNELATNAVKHAFFQVPEPRFTVELREVEKGELLLTVEDNGPGLPEGFDPERHSHLGIKLALALASQAGGGESPIKFGRAVDGTGARFEIRLHPGPGSYGFSG